MAVPKNNNSKLEKLQLQLQCHNTNCNRIEQIFVFMFWLDVVSVFGNTVVFVWVFIFRICLKNYRQLKGWVELFDQ